MRGPGAPLPAECPSFTLRLWCPPPAPGHPLPTPSCPAACPRPDLAPWSVGAAGGRVPRLQSPPGWRQRPCVGLRHLVITAGIRGRLWRLLWHVQDPLPSNTSRRDLTHAGSLLPGLPTSPPVLQGPPGPWGERPLPGPCLVTQAAPRPPPSTCDEPAGLRRFLPGCSHPRPPTLRPRCLQFQGDAAAQDPSSAAPTRRGAPVLPAHSLHSCFLLPAGLLPVSPLRVPGPPGSSLLRAFPQWWLLPGRSPHGW